MVSPTTIAATLELKAGTVAELDPEVAEVEEAATDDDSGADEDAGADDDSGAEEDAGADEEAGALDSHVVVGKKLPLRMLPACTSTCTKHLPSAAANNGNRTLLSESGPIK